jgi:hypothetical protein
LDRITTDATDEVHVHDFRASIGLPFSVQSTKTLLLPAASHSLIKPDTAGPGGFVPSLHNPMLTLASFKN